jgi:hypothetical protein
LNFDPESIKQVPLTNEDLYRRQMAMLKSFLEHCSGREKSTTPGREKITNFSQAKITNPLF